MLLTFPTHRSVLNLCHGNPCGKFHNKSASLNFDLTELSFATATVIFSQRRTAEHRFLVETKSIFVSMYVQELTEQVNSDGN